MRAPHLGFRTLQEEVGPLDLAITGRVPDWLDGALLRTGPALFEVGRSSYRHWFDGLAMLYRFSFGGGRVQYTNRLLHSRAHEAARAKGRIVQGGFGTAPDNGVLGRLHTLVFGAVSFDNANVNVVARGDGAFALTETPTPIAFDPHTLETLGPRPCRDGLHGHITTAHPQTDARRGVQVNYLMSCGPRTTIHVLEQPLAGGRRRRVGSVAVQEIPYMHSFGMTDHYIVLVEPPYRAQPLRLRFSLKPPIESYRWLPGEATRFHLIYRDSGRVRTVEGPPCFAFHQANTFEDGDSVVVDLCAYPDASVMQGLSLDRLRGPGIAGLHDSRLLRYRLPKAGGTAQVEEISAQPAEMPRINDGAVAGRRYRSLWVAGRRGPDSAFLDRLVHVDVEHGTPAATWESEDCYVGEPVFIPRPGARDEDDGVVAALVLDAAAGRSSLLLLEARSLGLLARAELPHAIPFDFHGQHMGGAAPLEAAMN